MDWTEQGSLLLIRLSFVAIFPVESFHFSDPVSKARNTYSTVFEIDPFLHRHLLFPFFVSVSYPNRSIHLFQASSQSTDIVSISHLSLSSSRIIHKVQKSLTKPQPSVRTVRRLLLIMTPGGLATDAWCLSWVCITAFWVVLCSRQTSSLVSSFNCSATSHAFVSPLPMSNLCRGKIVQPFSGGDRL